MNYDNLILQVLKEQPKGCRRTTPYISKKVRERITGLNRDVARLTDAKYIGKLAKKNGYNVSGCSCSYETINF